MHPTSEELDRTFSALAHPMRRSILTRLAREGGASISELAEPFDVTLMAVSKHVKVMERAGLVQREKDGRVQRCTFDPKAMESASRWIDRHRDFWESQLDALARYLEPPDSTEAADSAEAPGPTSEPGPRSEPVAETTTRPAPDSLREERK